MKRKTFSILLSTALLTGSFGAFSQTLKTPAPSPSQTLKQAFGIGEITVDYSRPSVKGRTVFGDLVPFGKIWRTGANGATKLTFSEDVTLEGNTVAAGTYALYSVPNKDSWDIILYKDLTLGGNVSDFKAENELLRFKVKPSALTYKVETFTIDVANITAKTASIELRWDKTQVAINVATSFDDKVMKSIQASVIDDKRPYFPAATYYYENDKDLNKALEWTNKAIEQNPKAFYMIHLKAKILLKQKDYKGAIGAAEQSLASSKEAKNDDYIKMNEKLIEEAKKGK